MLIFFRYLVIFCFILLPINSIAQVCRMSDVLSSAPTSRYVINDNGTVIDKITGLMWKKCSEGQTGDECKNELTVTYTWQLALQQAKKNNDIKFAGYSDWRVPNIKELFSIMENQCTPGINLTVFPNTPPLQGSFVQTQFWSSTPQRDTGAGNDPNILLVDYNMHTIGFSLSWKSFFVRLVRG
jgi:hypothetical protein